LSTTIVRASGRAWASCVRTSTTRAPVSERSTSIAKHSRVKSSTIVRLRNQRPLLKRSWTKSIDQRSFGRVAGGRGRRATAARSRRRRRATPRRPPAAPRPSRAFSQFILQELEVQCLVGHHAFEAFVLLLECPHPLQFLALESAVQPLPAVEGVLPNTVLPD